MEKWMDMRDRGARRLAHVRARRGLALGVGLLAAGWLALLGLMFLPCLWVANSFLGTQFAAPYTALWNLLPAGWVAASRTMGVGRLIASAAYMLLMLGVWLAYWQVARHVRTSPHVRFWPRRRVLRAILLGLVVFGVLTLPWPGLFTTDIYLYGLQGRMQLLHGYNPFVLPLNVMITTDPFTDLTPWRQMLTAYGPAWLLATRLIGIVAQALGATAPIYVLVYKSLNLVLLAAATALLWAITGMLGWGTVRRVEATLLFGWCPLLILDMVGNGHNDMLLVLAILAAIWCHLRGWWPLAVVALVLGGLVKMPGYFLLPAYLVLLARTAPGPGVAVRRLPGALTLGGAMGILAYVPYADPRLPHALLSNPMTGMITNSWFMLLRDRLADLAVALRGSLFPASVTWNTATEALRLPLWYGALGVWAGFALGVSLGVRDLAGLLRAWALLFLSYLLFASPWFQPWYIAWLLPIVVLLPTGPLRRSALLLALGGTLFYAVFPPLPGDTHWTYEYYVPGVIFGPMLLYWAWEVSRALVIRLRLPVRLHLRPIRVQSPQPE